MSEVKLQIPQPPDILFEKQKTGHLLNEKSPVYLIEKMELVENFGMCITYKNVPYVKKGFPTPEALYAINQVKKLILEFLKLCKNPFFLIGILFTDKNKLLQSFNVVFDKIFGNQAIKEQFMCRSAFYLAKFVHSATKRLGVDESTAKQFSLNIAQIIEYDDAYRYRFQDLMKELDVGKIKISPRKELQRIFEILLTRSSKDDGSGRTKIVYLVAFLKIYVIFFKKTIEEIEIIKNCQPDSHDTYWMCLRNDGYNYFGLSVEERHKLYTERPEAYEVMA